MYNLNRVTLIGQLTADPLLKETSSGQKMLNCRLATNYSWKEPSGEWSTAADFHSVIAWERVAEQAERQLKKGMRVFIEGKIRSRSWDGEDGNKRFSVDIVAHTILPMVSGNGSASPAESADVEGEGEQPQEVSA